MNGFLRQSTASQSRLIGPFVDEADFKTAETGLTIANTDIKLSVNGGASANKNSGGGTHRVNGFYGVTFDATDTATVGQLTYSVSVSGALPVWGTFTVLEEAIYDALFASNADFVNLIWDEEISANAHNIKNSAARILRTAGGGTQATIRSGTAQGGTANTITLDASADSTNEIYTRNLVVITGGPGVGQTRRIVSYNGSTKVATVDQTWTTNPTSSSTFDIIASPISIVSDEGVAQAGSASTITLDSQASALDDIFVGSLVTITSGTGSGQTRTITDYVGATKVATVDTNWTINPDNTSVYAVIPAGDATSSPDPGSPSVSEIAVAVWEYTTRLLTAGTNLGILDAAGIRSAVGLGSANLDTQLDNLPTNAELTAALAAADDAVLLAIAALNNLSQADVRTAVGLGSANLDTQLDNLPTNSELTTAIGTVLTAIAALNDLSQAGVRAALGMASANLDSQLSGINSKTTNLPNEPAAVGSAMTLDLTQALDELTPVVGSVGEALIASRAQGFGKWVLDPDALTLTLFASDGTTPLWVFDIDSATAPTTRTPR